MPLAQLAAYDDASSGDDEPAVARADADAGRDVEPEGEAGHEKPVAHPAAVTPSPPRGKAERQAASSEAHPTSPPTPAERTPPSKPSSKHSRRHQRRSRAPPGADGLPPDLTRELSRTGQTLSDVVFVDVDARASASLPVRASAACADASAVAARAGRIAKKAPVSRTERRKHQITALAADAAALAAARQSLGVGERSASASALGRRR